MTTKLNQKRVKSSDPGYPSLQEQLEARLRAEGTGYVMPVGGIPRGDMTQDVQNALTRAETAYVIPPEGIPASDLHTDVQSSLAKADTAYQKPVTGIPAVDLDPSIQTIINDYSSYYVFPTTGIPYIDLDQTVRDSLDKADTAYQKPAGGIPETDLDPAILAKLDNAAAAYRKPTGGIPLSDLEQQVALPVDVAVVDQKIIDHMNDASKHITDHANLIGIGRYTHDVIDAMLDDHGLNIDEINKELSDARGSFADLNARITASLFRSSEVVYQGDGFLQGTIENLTLSEDGNLGFLYVSEPFEVEFYDCRTTPGYEQSNKILTEDHDQIYLDWPGTVVSFGGANLAVDVGIVVDGYLYAPVTGVYAFAIHATGDYQLTVHDSTLVATYSPAQFNANVGVGYIMNVHLYGGQMYRFTLTGKNKTSANSILRVRWKRPDEDLFEPVPSQFFSKSSYTGDLVGRFTTPIIDTVAFNVIEWKCLVDSDMHDFRNYIAAEVQMSTDGVSFGPWTPYEIGELITETPDRYIRFRLTLTRGATGKSPIIQKVMFQYVSSNNSYVREVELARGSYLTLNDRLAQMDQLINDAVDLATFVNESNVDANWLAHVRFEHIDINMLRMYWREMQRLNSAVYLLHNGFVDDFNTLDHLDTARSSKWEIKNSKAYLLPEKVIWDTDADWMQFTRLNCSPESGTLKLTYIANGQVTGPSTEIAVDVTTPTNTHQSGMLDPRYQGFYVPENTYRITQVQVKLGSVGGVAGSATVYLVPAKTDGKPDDAKATQIGSFGYSAGTKTINCDVIVPAGQRKWFVKLVGGAPWDYWNYRTFSYLNTPASNMPPHINGQNPGSEILYMLDHNKNPVTNAFIPITVTTQKALHPSGNAEIIVDTGVITNFLTPELDADAKDGVIEIKYASSEDGTNYSSDETDLSRVPNGRYLKVKINLVRSSTNQTPEVRRLAIRHTPTDTVWQTKPVSLSQIPTHVIVDRIDSGNGHFRYYVSRDGGSEFTEVIPGMQCDLRSIVAGTSLVLKIVSDWSEQDDNHWLDYVGVQAIVHNEFSKSNIVSHYQEEVAQAGQTVFTITKPYYIGDHSLQVYKDGKMMSVGVDYEETNNTTVTFLQPCQGGERIIFRVAAGAYQFADSVTEDLSNDVTNLKTRMTSAETHLQTIDGQTSALESRATSVESRATTLESTVQSLDGRLDVLEGQNLDTRVSTLETTANSLGTRLDAAELELLAQDGRLDTLEPKVTTLETQVQTLNTDVSTLQSDVDTVKTDVQSVSGRVSTLETQIQQVIPVGAVMQFATLTPPSGWLLADGSEVSRVTYADLFVAIGTQFGEGDGATTFNLPNLGTTPLPSYIKY